MIDFHYWPTPNGWKVAIMLEECGLPYRVVPVNIGAGDQFRPEFLAISPNNRMPAILDHDAPGGPLPVFESGSILIHLAERTGRFMPAENPGRKECLEWLFWQVGNLGPMAGQLSHFVNYAEGEHPYSRSRYANEYHRCLGVLERRLEGRDYILDDGYSVADMASWPWVLISIVPYHRDGTVKLLALASPERAPPLPEVPTFTEIGYPDLSVEAWLALFAPAATPAPVMAVLNRALVAAVDSPSFREHATSQVQKARSSSVQEMSDSLSRQVEVWRRIIEPLNLQID